MNKREQDPLDRLFKQLPDEPLPADFRLQMMDMIHVEAARMQKTKERWGLVAVILGALAMLALSIVGFIYLKIPRPSITMPSLDIFPFYVYIGILTFVLLGIDHKFRKEYLRRHSK